MALQTYQYNGNGKQISLSVSIALYFAESFKEEGTVPNVCNLEILLLQMFVLVVVLLLDTLVSIFGHKYLHTCIIIILLTII